MIKYENDADVQLKTITTPARIVTPAELADLERQRRPDPVRWVLAADLGQQHDPTAIAVASYVQGDRGRALDFRHLERLPLGTSYTAATRHIAEMLNREPLRGRCALVIDQTGVGRAVFDLMRDEGLDPCGVTITAGESVTETAEGFRVGKLQLVSGLVVAMQTGGVRIAEGLPDAAALREELQSFSLRVSASANLQFDAEPGAYDDLVIAVCLAVFYAQSEPERCELW